jgi:hypothetical protein
MRFYTRFRFNVDSHANTYTHNNDDTNSNAHDDAYTAMIITITIITIISFYF